MPSPTFDEGDQVDYITLRRRSVLGLVNSDGVDTCLISNPYNITYLTGLARPAGFLILSNSKVTLVTDHLTAERVESSCPGLATHVYREEAVVEATAEFLRKVAPKAIAVDSRHMSVDVFERLRELAPKVPIQALPDRVERFRALKDPSEVEEIRASVRVAERAFHMFCATLRENDTEREMRDALDSYVRRSGGWDVSLPTIVSIGDRGALADTTPGDLHVAEGSKLLVDFGATLRYKSRLTRTFRTPFGITPTRRTKRERLEYDLDSVFATVVAARDAATSLMKEGALIQDADSAAREVFQKAGLLEFAVETLGHGVGLEAVEAPFIRTGAQGAFEAGMVISFGAGVRIPGWGAVRIADPILVTRDRTVPLTNTPASLSGIP